MWDSTISRNLARIVDVAVRVMGWLDASTSKKTSALRLVKDDEHRVRNHSYADIPLDDGVYCMKG